MMSLNYYLSQSCKGNPEAAFEAARIMYNDGTNEVIVQNQLRKAAEGNNAEAQRWLGLFGLCHKLVNPESTVSHITYYHGYEKAYHWLLKSASLGDNVSAFIVAKCLQNGVGVAKDESKAEKIIAHVVSELSLDAIFPVVMLFDTIRSVEGNRSKSVETVDLRQLLAS